MRTDPDPIGSIDAARPVVTATGTAVFFCPDDKVGVRYLRTILATSVPVVIVVSIDGATHFTRKESEDRGVQFLLARDLVFNKTHHALVPRHTRVAHPPAGMDVADLPRLLLSDPIAQYYAWPVDTVVCVERCFGGHEPIPYFRRVALS